MQVIYWKRWLFVITALFLAATGYGQSLKNLEYFFDADPGIGNGQHIDLAGKQQLDSTFRFDVAALTAGGHVVYIRAADNAGSTGLYYSQAFVKVAGSDSALQITRLEYFVDSDPGFGKGIAMPLQAASIINDTFHFSIPDNGADTRKLYVRAQDTHGRWSLLYDSTISLCSLYKTRANFGYIRFSNQYSFIDSSINNPMHKLMWNFDDLGLDSVSNPIFSFPQGNHFVKLVAGTGCRKDSIILPLFTGLEKYYPDSALAGGDIILNFYGGGLDTNVAITLTNGSAAIHPYEKAAAQQLYFAGIFDLHTATPGNYDINLHFPNGYDTIITGGLRVGSVPAGVTAYSPEITLSVAGPEIGRSGTTVTQYLIITNTGGMVAKSVPVWSSAMNDAEYTEGPGFRSFHQPDNQMNYQDSIPTQVGLDSLFGQPYKGKLHNFMIPALNAGQSFVYPYTLKVPVNHGDVNYVDFWVGKRMFGSPNEWNCIHQVLDDAFNVTGLLPVAGCAFGLTGFTVDAVSGFMGQFGYNQDRSYDNLGNFLYGAASAAWGCLPAVKTIEQAHKIAQATVLEVNGTKKLIDIQKAGLDAIWNHPDENPCDDKNPIESYRNGARGRVAADPNGINGPGGYADANYITGAGKQGYQVYFENQPTASAAAQRIYIADTLDKTRFDLASLELIGFTIADSFYHIPFQRSSFTTTVDLRPATNLLLRFNAMLDTAKGILNCSFLSLDPATRDTLPLSDLRGFLPPDINDKDGKASIAYVINCKKQLVTGDVVNNRAAIVFDNNAPIITNTWLNTIDRTAPVGGIIGGTRVNDTTVTLHFSGNDLGAGIQKFKLYGAMNNSPFRLMGFVTGDTMRISGSADSTYSFYAIPYDSVNNAVNKNAVAEYSVTFNQQALPVVLEKFYGEHITAKNYLHFTIKEMSGVKNIVIERSADSRIFTMAGTLPVSSIVLNGVNDFIDEAPLAGDNYYRLKIVDQDGKYQYSKVILLKNMESVSITCYPNPVKNNLVIKFGFSPTRRLMIRLTDISGRTLYAATHDVGGDALVNLPMAAYTNGVYIMEVKDTGGQTLLKQKIVKE